MDKKSVMYSYSRIGLDDKVLIHMTTWMDTEWKNFDSKQNDSIT